MSCSSINTVPSGTVLQILVCGLVFSDKQGNLFWKKNNKMDEI